MGDLPPLPLPVGITSRYINCTVSVGLKFHILESGKQQDPLLLLIHGFPELAFSWRKVLPGLADAEFHVIAVDQRGYGRTAGWDDRDFSRVDLRSFTFLQLVADMVALVRALGHERARCVVGHDFGAVTASTCALVRPDVFTSCVMMSYPFKGSPKVPFGTAAEPVTGATRNEAGDSGKENKHKYDPDITASLAALDPPRKHYTWANSMATAADDWLHPPQGLHALFRGYMHLKSSDWARNSPHPLAGWTAHELAKMPHYYIMPLSQSMGEVVVDSMKGEDATLTKRWMSDDDIGVFVSEWSRTGFQGGLNWYRSGTSPVNNAEMLAFAGRKIECPSTFISGAKDWGNFQEPGALESYEENCSDFRGRVFVDGAGHWPQQEQPEAVTREILKFVLSLK